MRFPPRASATDAGHVPARQQTLRWTKYILFAAGVVMLGCCATLLIDAALYQSYENWSFEQFRADRPISRTGFLLHFVRGAPPTTPAHPPPPNAPARGGRETQKIAAPILDDGFLGRLEIPGIGLSASVREGVDGRTLRRAVGHVPDSALPGATGNVVLAAHRDTFFRTLRNIHSNDQIVLSTLDRSYTYVVDSLDVVQSDDVRALLPTPDATLTLVTCYPFYFVGPAPQRFIVRAHKLSAP